MLTLWLRGMFPVSSLMFRGYPPQVWQKWIVALVNSAGLSRMSCGAVVWGRLIVCGSWMLQLKLKGVVCECAVAGRE